MKSTLVGKMLKLSPTLLGLSLFAVSHADAGV